jgi:hypothetical protein
MAEGSLGLEMRIRGYQLAPRTGKHAGGLGRSAVADTGGLLANKRQFD